MRRARGGRSETRHNGDTHAQRRGSPSRTLARKRSRRWRLAAEAAAATAATAAHAAAVRMFTGVSFLMAAITALVRGFRQTRQALAIAAAEELTLEEAAAVGHSDRLFSIRGQVISSPPSQRALIGFFHRAVSRVCA